MVLCNAAHPGTSKSAKQHNVAARAGPAGLDGPRELGIFFTGP